MGKRALGTIGGQKEEKKQDRFQAETKFVSNKLWRITRPGLAILEKLADSAIIRERT